MAVAKDNEKIFTELFTEKVIGSSLMSQRKFEIRDDKDRKLSSSVDYYFEHGNRQILIEIDSYNMAKVLVGQYLLLNQFRDKSLTNPTLLIIHTYKNYNPDRTIKYFEYINKKVMNNSGIPFGVIHIDTFKNWHGGEVDDFLNLFNA